MQTRSEFKYPSLPNLKRHLLEKVLKHSRINKKKYFQQLFKLNFIILLKKVDN